MPPRFLAVIPAYNEEATIGEVARKARRHLDVCVVNDASTDATAEIARSVEGVHVISHERNTHLARAILDGMRYAVEQDYDFCITLDAGMSHDPDVIPRFQSRTDADLVLGVRTTRIGVPLYRRALSWGAAVVVNLVIARRRVPWGGAGLRDVTSGYRMYSRDALDVLLDANLQCRAFGFHMEALTVLYRAGARIEEIPISYVYSNSSLRAAVVVEGLRGAARLWKTDPAQDVRLRKRRASASPSQ